MEIKFRDQNKEGAGFTSPAPFFIPTSVGIASSLRRITFICYHLFIANSTSSASVRFRFLSSFSPPPKKMSLPLVHKKYYRIFAIYN